ncbi:P-loop containing nucleoside triphosphate hydrolase protein [Tribonema minus]|uniref:P-loop containing nucleoside triphosphate hydrolase protein n=1 Tax=Tribonema minus TaxID=303371 RepID=A0A836CAA6_9STRA|nr:P-loop containing nucleoside triphosphate hydrolase protein [Tribonema minus]
MTTCAVVGCVQIFDGEFSPYSASHSIADVAAANVLKAAILCAFGSFHILKWPVLSTVAAAVALICTKMALFRGWTDGHGAAAAVLLVTTACTLCQLAAVRSSSFVNDYGEADPDVELMPTVAVTTVPKSETAISSNAQSKSPLSFQYLPEEDDDLAEPLLTGDYDEVEAGGHNGGNGKGGRAPAADGKVRGQNGGNGKGVRTPAADTKASTMRSLLHYAQPDALLLSLGLCFLLVSATARLALPNFTSRCLAAVVSSEGDGKDHLFNNLQFRNNLAYLVGTAAVYAFFSMLRIWCTAKAEVRLMARVQRVLFAAIMRQDISYFDKYGTGQLTSRLTSDATMLGAIITTNCNWVIQTSLSLFGSMGYLFFLEPRLAGVYVAIATVFFVITRQFGSFVRKLQKKIQDVKGDANQVADQSIALARLVRAFAAEEWEQHHYDKSNLDMVREQLRSKMAYSLYVPVVAIVQNALTFAVLCLGGFYVTRGQMSGADLTAFLFYSQTVQDNMNTLSEQIISLFQGLGAGEKIFEIIQHQPTLPITGGLVPPGEPKGELKLNNVGFAYPGSPQLRVIENMNLTIRPGERVAAVGPSGGGKSSLVGLVLRYYDPVQGTVLFDGHDIRVLDPRWLRRQIGVVTQDPFLFGVSVRDNIAYGRPDMSLEEVHRAARLASAHDFILQLPLGYETVLGERGVTLSGGQRQRVAIARALARQPKLLILDEATSALDSSSEHEVQTALQTLHAKTRTSMLIVAHRLSTIQDADRILVIQRGHIVEQGTHTELLARKGVYSVLVSRQLQTELLEGDQP